MKLFLRRFVFGQFSTIGELMNTDTGEHICWTLEDVCRDEEITREPYKLIRGQTAIPAGDYILVTDWSPRFKQNMPHILTLGMDDKLPCADGQVFSGVRIHWGNGPGDTEGCILLGATRGAERIYNSVAAYSLFFRSIQGVDRIELRIVNDLSEAKT